MGWKAVKDYYKIGHIVQVTPKGICIGSGYINDLIVISPDGEVHEGELGVSGNADLARYYAEMTDDKPKLRELVAAQDSFAASIPVYTFHGSDRLARK